METQTTMIDPWDLKADDSRVEDSLPTFVIFCEDEWSEYLYFKMLETNFIKVNVINKQKSMMDNVLNAITYCKDNSLLAEDEGGAYKLSNDGLYIWCVYDRDIEDDPTKHTKGNTEFDEAIKTAGTNGIRVAWSIDAFELWVLLHVQDVDPEDMKYANRDHYYDLLTDFFKKLPNPNEDLKKALAHASFSYKKDLKHKNNFKYIVAPVMGENIQIAIERAKHLYQHHNSKVHHHQRVPSTLVYLLVEELLAIGTPHGE
ncbi:MAG: RloB domain-containing protein [Chryseobacterium sp.]|nr:MAG: RloB domain-containing protein [Chryseobacterium sp.]